MTDITNLLEIVTSLLVGKLWLRKDLSNKLVEIELPISGLINIGNFKHAKQCFYPKKSK